MPSACPYAEARLFGAMAVWPPAAFATPVCRCRKLTSSALAKGTVVGKAPPWSKDALSSCAGSQLPSACTASPPSVTPVVESTAGAARRMASAVV